MATNVNRPCEYRNRIQAANGLPAHWTEWKPGTFHRFTLDHDDCGEFGPAHFPAAIVEKPNGEVTIPYAKNVRFIAADIAEANAIARRVCDGVAAIGVGLVWLEGDIVNDARRVSNREKQPIMA